MSGSNRLPAPWGIALKREQRLSFTFEGEQFEALQGDTIASALAAGDQWLISRSFKYHRPRGVLTMAGQDANTLVQLPGAPNALADRVLVTEALSVSAQNYSGSLRRDRGALVGLFARFLPVAFYYKAFFRPRGIWNLWAKFFRGRAGLGVIDTLFTARDYDKQYRFCDVVVIGAGPAGLRAALACAAAGATVLLLDEQVLPGGSLNYASDDARETRDALVEKIRGEHNIEFLAQATVSGWFADNYLSVVVGKRLLKLRAKQVVLASGALEQPALFRNNDLPGIMLGGAARRLMHLYAVRPGKKVVVLAGNDEAYAVAKDLREAGVQLCAIVDLREAGSDAWLAQELRAAGVRIISGHTVYAAEANKSGLHLGAVEIREIIAAGECAAPGERINCDLLCVSVGYMPTYQLACQAGGQLHYDDASAEFSITNVPGSFHLVGAVAGDYRQADLERGVQRVCECVMENLGLAPNDRNHADAGDASEDAIRSSAGVNHPWPIFAHKDGKEFVDFDEDLTIADIINATRDGYEDIQLVKRYSTCGMGPSQGRHSALASARLVARATGKSVAQTGVTTARPPFAPETIAHCAGRGFFPARRSAMHHRHIEAGAQMMQAGAWYRPAFYGEADNASDSIQAEVEAVRGGVAIIDVSTLGGIEVRGADAAEFLNRIYTFAYLKQPVGRSRYALMTNEAGVVIDDGVSARFSDNHFYVTATTGGVDRVFQKMLQWNAQWRLDVDLANVTGALCGVNLAGPDSRKVLERVCNDIDLSPEAFPYLGVRVGTVAGIKALIMRVGFVGELGYEIHAPQHEGEALWDALIAAGGDVGIRPFGVEAQRVLRLEKGHVIVGQDTDAMSNPMELQMQWAIAGKKPFFVGGRTLQVLAKKPLERMLVGFIIRDSRAAIPKESHLVVDGDLMLGRVTSCAYSPTLATVIGLAYVPPELGRVGDIWNIRCDGGELSRAEVVALPFFDPQSERQAL